MALMLFVCKQAITEINGTSPAPSPLLTQALLITAAKQLSEHQCAAVSCTACHHHCVTIIGSDIWS
jgi:hypothetical protein